jgi:hypothetical protein
MHHAKTVSPLITALTVFALASEAIAAADDEAKDIRRRHRTSEILIHQDSPRPEAGKSWIESHMALRKGIGVVYRYKTETDDDRKLVFSVGGPVLKKKRFGMMFEIRF